MKFQEQEEAEQRASWHAETAKCHEQLLKQKQEEHEVSRALLEAQEEFLAETGQQEQAYRFKEELFRAERCSSHGHRRTCRGPKDIVGRNSEAKL